jgi:putative addiction module component (TIGR02574 family)
MPMKIEELTEQALALPNEAKALLVDRLVESLDPSEAGELHDLWAGEAQRRLRELRSGAVQAIPGDEALARLREQYTG